VDRRHRGSIDWASQRYLKRCHVGVQAPILSHQVSENRWLYEKRRSAIASRRLYVEAVANILVS